MIRVIYTDHAERRIAQRGIGKRWVEKTIYNPDEASISFKNRSEVRKKFGSKML